MRLRGDKSGRRNETTVGQLFMDERQSSVEHGVSENKIVYSTIVRAETGA